MACDFIANCGWHGFLIDPRGGFRRILEHPAGKDVLHRSGAAGGFHVRERQIGKLRQCRIGPRLQNRISRAFDQIRGSQAVRHRPGVERSGRRHDGKGSSQADRAIGIRQGKRMFQRDLVLSSTDQGVHENFRGFRIGPLKIQPLRQSDGIHVMPTTQSLSHG